jgi:hypothetical protein
MVVVLGFARGSAAAALIAIPINIFVLWVLVARRGYFVKAL